MPRVASRLGVNMTGALPFEEPGGFSAMDLDKSAWSYELRGSG